MVQKYLPQQQQSPDLQILQTFISSSLADNDIFSIPTISTDDVKKSLLSLDIHKSTGLDGLSAKLLKLATPAITTPLTYIFNHSTGKFPSKWKTSRVTPIHKSGAHSDQNNYRPISILSIASKILERHIHDCFYSFLIKNRLLDIAQSGFRVNHSCETALARLIHMWTSNMDNGLLNGIVFVDFRKAFDLVDTNLLLQKLAMYHCDKTSLAWFKSYLQDRRQCVQYKSSLSSPKQVSHGVPQGSILGPLLFITYVNDLPLHITSNMDMYADDSTIHTSAHTVNELNDKLNDMVNMKNWCANNNMVINREKTKSMLVTTHQKASTLPTDQLDIVYDNSTLQNVETEKLLGVVIDKHLSWKRQVDKVASTISKSIALLRRIKCYLPLDTRLTYYKTFLQPHIDYCNIIWGQSNHIMRLLKLQKMALRIIYDKPKMSASKPLFKESGLLPIQERVKLRTVTMVYKSVNNTAPQYISDMFKIKSAHQTRVTRSSTRQDLCIPKAKLTLTRKALPYSGATLYNKLPLNVRGAMTLKDFTTKAYQHYMYT